MSRFTKIVEGFDSRASDRGVAMQRVMLVVQWAVLWVGTKAGQGWHWGSARVVLGQHKGST